MDSELIRQLAARLHKRIMIDHVESRIRAYLKEFTRLTLDDVVTLKGLQLGLNDLENQDPYAMFLNLAVEEKYKKCYTISQILEDLEELNAQSSIE